MVEDDRNRSHPMRDAIREIALFIYRHEYSVPLSAVPLFLIFRLVCRKLRGSLLVLSLSTPGLVYPLGLAGAQDVLGAMFIWFVMIPAMWKIPLVAVGSAIRLWLVVDGRLKDSPFLSPQTVILCAALLGLYASVWLERYRMADGCSIGSRFRAGLADSLAYGAGLRREHLGRPRRDAGRGRDGEPRGRHSGDSRDQDRPAAGDRQSLALRGQISASARLVMKYDPGEMAT